MAVSKIKETILGNLLGNVHSDTFTECAIYGPRQHFLGKDTPILLADPDDLDEDEDDLDEDENEPEEARERGFKYLLLVTDAIDIVSNVKSQLARPTLEHFVQAFNFYCDNDAFIVFGEQQD